MRLEVICLKRMYFLSESIFWCFAVTQRVLLTRVLDLMGKTQDQLLYFEASSTNLLVSGSYYFHQYLPPAYLLSLLFIAYPLRFSSGINVCAYACMLYKRGRGTTYVRFWRLELDHSCKTHQVSVH